MPAQDSTQPDLARDSPSSSAAFSFFAKTPHNRVDTAAGSSSRRGCVMHDTPEIQHEPRQMQINGSFSFRTMSASRTACSFYTEQRPCGRWACPSRMQPDGAHAAATSRRPKSQACA